MSLEYIDAVSVMYLVHIQNKLLLQLPCILFSLLKFNVLADLCRERLEENEDDAPSVFSTEY